MLWLLMANHSEDEEKIGENEDIARAETESRGEQASDNALLKAYLEDKEIEEQEEEED
jgi:hypothetical protein